MLLSTNKYFISLAFYSTLRLPNMQNGLIAHRYYMSSISGFLRIGYRLMTIVYLLSFLLIKGFSHLGPSCQFQVSKKSQTVLKQHQTPHSSIGFASAVEEQTFV